MTKISPPASADNRERIVTAALALFCARGFTGVGTQEICTQAGVLKGTLYHYFPSKVDIALAALEHYGQQIATGLRGVAEGAAPPDQQLVQIFAVAEQSMRQQSEAGGAVLGCLHGNLAMELAAVDGRVRAAIEKITADWSAIIAPIIEQLNVLGRIPPTEPLKAARAVIAYLHGVVLMAKAANDPAQVTQLGQRVIALLGG
jgi:TetR/AcrR family transcriptional repressor of nem operon